MSDDAAPIRWQVGDDPVLAEAVCTHLKRVEERLPDAGLVAQMRARLLADVGTRAAAGIQQPPVAEPSAATRPAGLRATVLLAATLALLGLGLWVGAQGERGAPHVRTAPTARVSAERGENEAGAPVALGTPVGAGAPVVAGTPVVRAAPPARRAPSPSGHVHRVPRAAPAAAAAGADELVLLRGARRLLATDPRAALALVDEHALRYRHGVFAEERELLRIEALFNQGDSDTAAAQATAFQRTYPQSVHLDRITRLLGAHGR